MMKVKEKSAKKRQEHQPKSTQVTLAKHVTQVIKLG
jgi:hypothetical protein